MTDQEQHEAGAEAKRESARVSLYLGLAAIIISLLVGGGIYLELRDQTIATRKIASEVRQVQDERVKATRAANEEQVNQCFIRNAQMPGLLAVLVAFRDQLSDPVARAQVQDYIAQIAESTPTIRECNDLARSLGLPVRRARPRVPR